MKKSTCGMTLIELLVCIGILTVVSACAGSVMFASFQSFAVTTKLQDDQYNSRMALLSITREAHTGVETGASRVEDGKLILIKLDGAEVIYYISNGWLVRETNGEPSVAFTSVELESFNPIISLDASGNGRWWLELNTKSKYGLELSTKVSLSRIPMAVINEP